MVQQLALPHSPGRWATHYTDRTHCSGAGWDSVRPRLHPPTSPPSCHTAATLSAAKGSVRVSSLHSPQPPLLDQHSCTQYHGFRQDYVVVGCAVVWIDRDISTIEGLGGQHRNNLSKQ
jgi:hypothetical protein